MLPAALAAFYYRCSKSDLSLGLLMFSLIVCGLGTWIISSLETYQQQKNISVARMRVALALAILLPPTLPFLIYQLGRPLVVISAAVLALYYVSIQWWARGQLTLFSLLLGLATYTSLLAAIWTLGAVELVEVGFAFVVTGVLHSGLLQHLVGLTPPREADRQEKLRY